MGISHLKIHMIIISELIEYTLYNVILTPVVIAILIAKEMSMLILIIFVISCLPPSGWPREGSKHVGRLLAHKTISIVCMLLVLGLHYIWAEKLVCHC